MRVLNWLRSWMSIPKARLSPRRRSSRASWPRPDFRPRAEILEDRLAPALFGPAITRPTGGNGPFAVTVADFNGDGRPDIAVTNFNSGTLSVGLGNGDGTFTAAAGSPFAVGASASALTAADFNNDGLQDIAVADPTDNRVMFFFGSGFGARAFNLPASPLALQAADFNHDGFADVAVGLSNGEVWVIFGASTFAGFTSALVADGTGAVTALATGDFNNDGNGDIAVVRETGSGTTLSIYFGTGTGTFAPGPFISMAATRATDMVAGDFRGVGRLDLAIANFTNNTITIVLNNGGGTFQTPTVMPVLGNPFWLVAADFNRDGRVDLIKSNNANNSITPMIGNGDGTFVLTPSFNVGTAPKGMAVGDFNSDGKPDLVVVNSSSPGTESVLINTSTSTTHFNVSAPSVVGAETPFDITVTAADISNNPSTGFRDTVTFTSSDGSASLPANYTFTAADAGVHTFSVTLGTGGDQTIVVTDTSDATIRGFAKVTVTNPPPSLTSLGTTTAVEGSGAFTLTVTGMNFVPSSVVKWNGTALTTHFMNSSTQLTADVPAANVSDEGTDQVTVVTPTPGGGTAGPIAFMVTDAALTLTGKPLTANEGQAFTAQVATLMDANPVATTADFTSGGGSVVITWGDGTPTSAGTVVQAAGTFMVRATHTYAEEGSFTISMTVTDDGGSTISTSTSATIADAALTVSTNPIKVMMTVPFSGQVATFVDANPMAPLSDLSATIDWGDGTTTPGVITQPGVTGTPFVVSGAHTYATADTHIFMVTVTDVGGSSATGKALAGNFLVHDIAGRTVESGQWWLALSNGSNAFSNALWTTWSTGVTWVDVVTGDFNGDGRTDIAGRALETGQWWVGISNGTGFTTTLWTTWSTGVTWVDVKVGDFLGNGKMDIAGRALETGQWWVAQSNSTSFTNKLWTTWSTGVTWVDVNVGDFIGNGKADLIGRASQIGQWWLAQSDGTSFSNNLWTTWSPAVTWVDVNVGDFNGDKKADLVGRVLQTGQWWVSLSTGSTATTSLWAVWNAAVNWVDVKIGDFNGDGSSDLIGRDPNTGNWWVSYSNGSTAFSTTLIYASWSPRVRWVDVQVGDFNADGRDDIAGRDPGTGIWWVTLSNGTTGATTPWTSWSTGVTWVNVHTGVVV